jgi:hypothetical protein
VSGLPFRGLWVPGLHGEQVSIDNRRAWMRRGGKPMPYPEVPGSLLSGGRGEDRLGAVHGSRSCYASGCREAECVEANRLYSRKYARAHYGKGAHDYTGR